MMKVASRAAQSKTRRTKITEREKASVCVERELIIGAAVGDPRRGVAATRGQLGLASW